jgi:hypothetical protein
VGQQCEIENPRARVEHVFAEQKDRMGLFIRTIGIALRRPGSEWPISSTTSNALSSCATSPSHNRLVLRKNDPFVAIPNSNQAKLAGIRGSPARGENNSLIEPSSFDSCVDLPSQRVEGALNWWRMAKVDDLLQNRTKQIVLAVVAWLARGPPGGESRRRGNHEPPKNSNAPPAFLQNRILAQVKSRRWFFTGD